MDDKKAETSTSLRIKELRKRLGLSQAQFALKINKTPGFISLIETGRSGISENTVRDISNVYNVNEDWLRTGLGNMFLDEVQTEDQDEDEQLEERHHKIAERLHSLRNNNKMTISQFAAEIPCSRNLIAGIESGKRVPTEKFLRRVSDAFYVSFEWLITGQEVKSEKDDLERIQNYLARDSVARKVVLEAIDLDRDIWLDLDRLIQQRKDSESK